MRRAGLPRWQTLDLQALQGLQSASKVFPQASETGLRRPGKCNLAMPRYHAHLFDQAATPRYLIVWDLQWRVIECARLEPRTDLTAALSATIERLQRDGWRPEGTTEFGFVFLNRNNERRLLMLTARDPRATSNQSFSPFRS